MPEMLRSLGRFEVLPPPNWRWDTGYSVYWAQTFQEWLRHRYVPFQHWHVRPPEHEYSAWSLATGRRDRNDADTWHQDSVESLPKAQVGVWANREPTLLRPRQDAWNVYQPEPFEVILFDNTFYEHKSPEMTEETAKDRWFVRFYVDPTDRNPARSCQL